MKCEYCPTYGENWEVTHNMLPITDLLKILHVSVDFGLTTFRISGGEPFLYPERIFQILTKLNQIGVKDIVLNTNGYNLTRVLPRLEWFEAEVFE
jgi:cyclic pyranopterin phosphate synthase